MSTVNTARDAFDSFYSGTHDRCGQLLEQIGSFKGNYDVKVAHNTVVNDYYKTGCSDPQALLTQLTQAHDKARERDKKDKGRRKRDEDEEETYREDEDLSVLRYNQALLCLQLRQYSQAMLILEELFENIEPIDDFLAIKICFLLLELCLLQREPEQAVIVLAYLEKPNAFLSVLRSERSKGVEARAGDEAELADEMKDKVRVGEADDVGEDSQGDASEVLSAVTADSRATTAISGRTVVAAAASDGLGAEPAEVSEGPLPSLTMGAFLPRHGRPPDTISRAEYRFFVLMYRARLAVALKNTKAAKRDVKSALEVLDQELRHAPLLTAHPHTTGPPGAKGDKGRPCEESLREALHLQHMAMVFTLKAYLEYTRQNVRKAIKLLTLCQFNFAESRSGANSSVVAASAEGDSEDRAMQRRRKGGGNEEDALGEDQIPTDFHPAQDEACAAVFFNNIGCIHFLMHKPGLATLYFQKALQASLAAPPPAAAAASGKKNSHSKLSNFLGGKAGLTLPGVLATKHWLDRRAEISYNAGLQMLMCERPSQALKCFEQCIPVFRTWPRLWLRLAECSIEMHRQSLTPVASGAGETSDTSEATPSSSATWNPEAASAGHFWGGGMGGGGRALVWGIQGTGPHRRWLLTTSRDPSIGRRPAAGDEDEAGAKGAPPSSPPPPPPSSTGSSAQQEDRLKIDSEGALSYAAMCLRNVVVLVAPMLSDRAGNSAGGTGSLPAGGAANDGSGNVDGTSSAASVMAASSATATAGSSVSAAAATAGQDKASATAGTAGLRAAKAAAPGTAGVKAAGGLSGAGSRHQARDLLESDASLLEDAALVKLAYVSLCQHDHASALRFSRRLLEKNALLSPASGEAPKEPAPGNKPATASAGSDEAEEVRKMWTFQAQNFPGIASNGNSVVKHSSSVGCVTLAVMYLAEALLLSGKAAEARTLLGGFVSGNAAPRGLEHQSTTFSELERAASVHVVAGAGSAGRRMPNEVPSGGAAEQELIRSACGDLSAASPMGGLTPPSHLLFTTGAAAVQAAKDREGKNESEKEKANNSKDGGHAVMVNYPPTELPRLGDTQCMLYTNLGALHVQDGNLAEAERCCELALKVQPRALAPLRTLVYILMRKGQHSQALEKLRVSRMQA